MYYTQSHVLVIGKQQINCAASEFVYVDPPSGLSCTDYLGPFMSFAGGYLTNPNATSLCEFCAYRTTDQWMAENFHMFYSNRWRDFGVFILFTGFNVGSNCFRASGYR
jgi:ATP-binding cassette subfamily G (WHITE) protein 2 (SNQ2)